MKIINNENIIKKCRTIIDWAYPQARNVLMDNSFLPEIYLVNHILRLCMQMNDINAIDQGCIHLIQRQNDDGGWGYNNTNTSVIGITATELQLLMWSQSINEKFKTEEIDRAINKGALYIINKRHGDYWTDSEELQRKHGLCDTNHYIAQFLYYYKHYYDYCSNNLLDNLYKWYINNQAEDGGWHEIDKERFREGATADSIRALLPSLNNAAYIKKGVDFLISCQNPYMGYWAGGNHDKIYDCLKAILNSLWVIDINEEHIESINKGLNYILAFDFYSFNIEEMCDYLTVLIDIVNLNENFKKPKIFF